MPHISSQGKQALDELLRTKVEERKVPALFFGCTTTDEILYENRAGEKVFGQPDKGQVDANTTLVLASMTKCVTTCAVLQAVEKGLIHLDDADELHKLCPEIAEMEILDGYNDKGEIMRKAKNRITLKMLLSHNSGMAYGFNTPDIVKWREEHGVKDMHGPYAGVKEYTQPLAYEPGTKWRYSIGIDWAGVALERAVGKTLEEIMKEGIFGPCGMKSTSFYPTADIQSRRMELCKRTPGDGVAINDTAWGRPHKPEEVVQCRGGGGLYSTAHDYLLFLQNVLKSQKPGGIISPESFKILFTNALPPRGDDNTCYADMAKMATVQSYHDPDHLANGGQHIAHSIGLFLNTKDSKWGRKAGSGTWDGAFKTQFWLDPTTGIGAVCCTNFLAENPDYYMRVYNQYERALYDALEK